MTDQLTAETAFAQMWMEARTRVLTSRADQAETSAHAIRDRIPRFPGHADEMEADAQACERYAQECRAAVEDPSLPAPSGPNYPSKEASNA